MTRSKRIFIVAAIVFFVLLAYASYDISSRTSFPGSKSQLKERLKKQYLEADTLNADSVDKIK
jgi:regulatory protein YycI of two-component signal transduction system YycFG